MRFLGVAFLVGCAPAELVIGTVDSGPVADCEVLEQRYADALAEIQTCTEAAQCGQVLEGTSCGCTRNLVARLDADLSEWIVYRDAAIAQECWIGGTSVCDCPDTDGFDCIGGTCTWNYVR